MDDEAIVERIWPGREAQVEVLGGGITNHNFKVTVDDGVYVLRVAGRDTNLLGIDRRVEHEASLAAAAVGVGPEVVAFIEPEGYLVTRFIEGRPCPSSRCASRTRSRAWRESLRAVHAGPPLPARFISFRVVEDYRDDGVRARRRRPARLRVGASDCAAGSSAHGARRPSARATTTCSTRTSSTTAAGSGSSTGSTRGWATSSSTSPTSRSTTGSGGGAPAPARGLLRRRCARRTSARSS